MNAEIFLYVPLGLAVIAFVMYKQLVWRRVTARKMMLMPAVLAAIGLFNMKDIVAAHPTVTQTDLALVAGQIVVAVGIGLAMGKITTFRAKGSATYYRGGRLGAGLWVLYVVLRIGVDIGAGAAGAELASSIAVILLTVAVNRFTQNAVVLARRSGQPPVPTPSSSFAPSGQTAHFSTEQGGNPAAESRK